MKRSTDVAVAATSRSEAAAGGAADHDKAPLLVHHGLELLLHGGRHAQIRQLRLSQRAGVQDDHGAFARLDSLAGKAAHIAGFFALHGKHTALRRHALGRIQVRQDLHHFQDGVARLAVFGRFIAPHAVDLKAHGHGVFRKVEHHRSGPTLNGLPQQVTAKGKAERLLGLHLVGRVFAVVRALLGLGGSPSARSSFWPRRQS